MAQQQYSPDRGGNSTGGQYRGGNSSSGERKGGYQGKKTYGDKPAGGYQGKKTYGDKPAGGGYQGKKPYGDRPQGSGYQGNKPYGDRPQGSGYQGNKPYGDKPQGERTYGDKPAGGYQGTRPYGDRPQGGGYQGKKPYGDRPQGSGYQGNKPYGDKPQGEHTYGDKPAGGYQGTRPYGDRPQGGGYQGNKPYGDKPQGERTYGDKPAGGYQGTRPYGDRPQGGGYQGNKPYGDKPQGERTYGDKPAGGYQGTRSYGDRPQGGGYQGKKPYGDRPQGGYEKKPYGDKPQGERTYGDKPKGVYRKAYDTRPEDVRAADHNDTFPDDKREEDELPFLILGRNAVKEAIKSGRSIDRIEVLSDPDGSLREIIALAKERALVIRDTDKRHLDEICMPFGHGDKPGNHQGIVAYAAGVEYCTVAEILAVARERGEDPFVIVLDGILDPHNLGSIIRSAECVGAHGVIIGKRRSASVTSATVKASAGATEHIKIARVVNIGAAIDELKRAKLWIAGADMKGNPMEKQGLNGPLALVIGGEGEGLSKLVSEKCDFLVAIPQYGKIGSLNAGVAAAVLMFEKKRQDAQGPDAQGQE
ncbi:MAG TPA: 23S rRNA (guanosine(2251)-2'-O)-methyltransferase RlmB [Candidatus Cryosericum sp.]|nr:23S rRNA (guanosine(2251)-2'-O)-methyltransferase RlmB [Candidatus Cryosericum sp.]